MKKEDNLIWLLLPSFIGLFVSVICLIGLTFAWFKTNTTTNSRTIIAANFIIDSIVTEENGTIIRQNDSVYNLTPGNYAVSLTRTGTSQTTNGYSLIKLGDYIYHTSSLKKDDPIEFTIKIDTALTLEFVPVWGISDLDGEQSIDQGSQIVLNLAPPIEPTLDENIHIE